VRTKVLVIGLGEVGRPIYELVLESGRYEVYGYDRDPARSVDGFDEIPRGVDFLHITYPYTDEFVGVTTDYISVFKPKYVVIHSTVAPGTTRAIYEASKVPTAYSPVRGKHPRIKEHLKFWTKWVSAIPREYIDTFKEHLESVGLRVRTTEKPETLEIAKLWETVYRALMITGWQEIHRVARRYEADIVEVAKFIAEVHQVLKDRPIYYPDHIGGHCLIPNTQILNKTNPSPLWQYIIESNEKRREEKKLPQLKNDIEKMKLLWLSLIPKSYYSIS